MNLQEYQIAARKTAHHTSHLGMEYLILKLCGEAGELVRSLVDSDGPMEVLKESGDVLWYVSEIYTRLGLVIQAPKTTHWDEFHSDAVSILLAAAEIAETVGKAMRKSMPPELMDEQWHRVTRRLNLILYRLNRVALANQATLEAVMTINLAKLAARQAAGTVLGGLRANEMVFTSSGDGWISMVSCPPIQSGDSSDDVEVVDEHIDDDGNLSMTILLQDDTDSQTDEGGDR